MNDISISEVSRNFADYINRVAYRGESFTLIRGKKQVAELKPVPRAKKLGELKNLLKTLPELSEKEFDAFTDDLKLIRTAGNREMLRDPWES